MSSKTIKSPSGTNGNSLEPHNLLTSSGRTGPEGVQLTFESAWDFLSAPEFKDVEPHIIKAFQDFHKYNPDFYESFKQYALEAISRGVRFYSSRDLLAKIRWEKMIGYGCPEFKVNNNFASCLSRLFSVEYPRYKDFFEKRKKNE